MKYLTTVIVTALTSLIGVHAVLTVSPGLHSSLFYGEEGCPYSSCNEPCGSDGKKKGGEDEIPCPALLFGQSFLGQDFLVHSSFTKCLVFEFGFSFFQPPWTSFKEEPFGARDPPVFA